MSLSQLTLMSVSYEFDLVQDLCKSLFTILMVAQQQ